MLARAAVALGDVAEDFDRQRKRALLAGPHRADADDLAIDLFVAIIADRQHHGVFPRFAIRRMTHGAFDAQRRRRLRRALGHLRIEPEVVLARGTDRRAFEDRRLAMRTGSRCAGGSWTRGRRPRRAHEADPFPEPLL